MWVDVVVGVVAALVVAWLLLVVLLVLQRPRGVDVREVVRLLPDLVRLVTRLAKDRGVPRSARIALWCLLGYLAFPLDVVPDFIPVVGYADDVLAVLLVLRFVTRRAGASAVTRNWPGSPAGLAMVLSVAGLSRTP